MIPAPAPGLYADVPMDVYHTWAAANSSSLKRIASHSPAHVRWDLDHQGEPTEAQRVGSATHECVLQPDLFARNCVRGIEGDGRTKAVREARENLAREHPGAHVLAPAEYDLCVSLRDAVASHRVASRLLQGQPEQSGVWVDPETGVLCKGRFDLLSDKTPTVVDLKTARDASREAFERAIWTYGYHLQAAHYLSGANELGYVAQHFAFVAIEKVPPFCVAVYDLEPAVLAAAAEALRPLYETWARCERDGIWPGYSERVESIGIPEWAFRRMEAGA